MITKGIILDRIINTNTYYVRVPYLESSSNDASRLEATVSDNPSISEEYQVGDVVYVAFEEHQANKPVIIGRLYVEGNSARGSANFEALNVLTRVSLPEQTTIGGKDVMKLLNKVENLTQPVEQNATGSSAQKNVIATFNTNDFVMSGSDDFYSATLTISNYIANSDMLTITWGNCFVMCPIPQSGAGHSVGVLLNDSNISQIVRVKYELLNDNTSLLVALDSTFTPPSNYLGYVICMKAF